MSSHRKYVRGSLDNRITMIYEINLRVAI